MSVLDGERSGDGVVGRPSGIDRRHEGVTVDLCLADQRVALAQADPGALSERLQTGPTGCRSGRSPTSWSRRCSDRTSGPAR